MQLNYKGMIMANESNDEQLKAAIKGLRAELADKSLGVPGVMFVRKADVQLVLDHIERLQSQSKAPAETDLASEWKCGDSLICRLNERGMISDSIRVIMADGLYYDSIGTEGRARQLCALLNAAR